MEQGRFCRRRDRRQHASSGKSGGPCTIRRTHPTFVETVPGKGYRFIAAVEVVSEPETVVAPPAPLDAPAGKLEAPASLAAAAGNHEAPASSTGAPDRFEPAPAGRRNRLRLPVAIVAVVLVAAYFSWARLGGDRPGQRIMLAVLPFENLSGDPEREYLADGLADETIASLGQIDPDHVSVIGRTSTTAYKRTTKSLARDRSGAGRRLSLGKLHSGRGRAPANHIQADSRREIRCTCGRRRTTASRPACSACSGS